MQDQPLGYYTKQDPTPVVPMTAATGFGGTPITPPGNMAPKQKKKIFGIDQRKMVAVLVLVVFGLVGSLGVFISLRQRLNQAPVAPNAPESRPSADETKVANCTLSFDVPEEPPSTPPTDVVPLTCSEAWFSEDFTNDAALSNFTVGGSGSGQISNGMLDMTVPVAPAGSTTFDSRYYIETKKPITGEIIAYATIPELNAPNDNQGLINLNMDTGESDSAADREVVTVSVRKTTGNNRKVVFQTLKAGVTSDAIEQTITGTGAITLKTERTIGNTVIGSYDIGAGFVKIGETANFTKPYYVRVALRSDGSNTTTPLAQVTASLGRFSIICHPASPITCTEAEFDETFDGTTLSSRYDKTGQAPMTLSNGSVTTALAANTANHNPTGIHLNNSKQETGDFDLIADIQTLQSTADSGKVRLGAETMAIGDVYFDFVHTGSSYKLFSAQTSFRTDAGGTNPLTTNITVTDSLKMKMDRRGNTLILSYSTNGTTYTKHGEYTITSDPVSLRLVTRRDGHNEAVTSTLTNLELSCPATTVTYACNSTCTTDANCQTVNSDYVCATINSEKRCRLSGAIEAESCQSTPGVTPTPTIGCNNVCVTNSDCTNPDHICYNASGTEVCRLATNPTSSSCNAASTPAPTPTPTIGCNDVCSDNSDCSNSSHICYNNQCRLEENPTNIYCARETVATTSSQPVADQPELPEELPVSGPGDWSNWLKVGLGGLVIGAVLLLFI